jgi:hypothetical protein
MRRSGTSHMIATNTYNAAILYPTYSGLGSIAVDSVQVNRRLWR